MDIAPTANVWQRSDLAVDQPSSVVEGRLGRSVGMSELSRELREAAEEGARGYFPSLGLLQRAADELEKIEQEADTLAHEAAREAARADKAEEAMREPTYPPDFLNMP
jgi:hypothetical protein